MLAHRNRLPSINRHVAQLAGETCTARLAATGSPELVRHAAKNFQVRYEKVVDPTTPKHYAIDHSAGIFLLAPGGQFLAKFAYGTPVDDIARRLSEEIASRPPVESGQAGKSVP